MMASTPALTHPSFLMTTRLFHFVLVVAIPAFACLAGCTPPSPAEKAAATDNVLREIGVASPTVQPTETTNRSILENAAKSSNSDIDEVVPTPDAKVPVSGSSTGSKAIKATTTVDAIKKPWINASQLPREYWEVQYTGNTAAGLLHRTCTTSTTLGSEYVRNEAERRVLVSLNGVLVEQRVKIMTIERTNGEVVAIECTLEIGANKQTYKGNVSQGQLKISGTDNNQPFNVTLDFPAEYRGPFAVEQSMLRRPMVAKETRKLKYLDPILKKVVDGRLEASDFIVTPTLVGGIRELLEVRNLAADGDNSSQSLLWVDQTGEAFKSFIQANDILAFRTDPIEARLIASGFDLRAMQTSLIPLGGPVERLTNHSADVTSLRYRFSHRMDEPYRIFTDRVGQRIKSMDPRTVEVTVYQNGRDLDAELENGFAAKVESAALAASPFIPVNLPQIERLARGLVAADKSLSPEKASNSEKAYACQREIQKRISLNEFDKKIGTVVNSIATKQANCVEHACLLASVCRSLGIPTRIALGVKYNRVTEMPAMKFHAWIEIRDGARWVPIDSSDDAYPTSIDRIKIRESYFDNENPYIEILSVYRLLPDLEIQVLP